MKQSEAMGYGSRKASPDVLKPLNTYMILEVIGLPTHRSALRPYTPNPSIGFPSSSPLSSRRPVRLSHFHHPLLPSIDFPIPSRRLSSHSPIGLPIPPCPSRQPIVLPIHQHPSHSPTGFPVSTPTTHPLSFPSANHRSSSPSARLILPPTRRSASTSKVMSYLQTNVLT
jgi:hypothetical protein